MFKKNCINNVTLSGEALDLFYRYGFFSLSVRVVPRDDSGSWLIREPTAAIFQEGTVQKQVRKINNQAFDQDFQVWKILSNINTVGIYYLNFVCFRFSFVMMRLS